jgi:hypothetical protein
MNDLPGRDAFRGQTALRTAGVMGQDPDDTTAVSRQSSVVDTGNELLPRMFDQRAKFLRGGRSMGAGNCDGCGWSPTGEKPADRAIAGTGLAGISPQCSTWTEKVVVEPGGTSGDREHDPPAQGPGRSEGPGEPRFVAGE